VNWAGSAFVLAGLAASLLAPLSAGSAVSAPVFGPVTPVGSIAGTDLGGASELETGDLNGDGLADVVITRLTYPPAHITHPIGILLANGHGGYVDGSSMWDGPPARTEWGRQILIADFNGDHRNDIFVADHGYDAEPFPGHPNELALSTPDGKLVDASGNIPPESGFSHSAAAADIDGDGDIDIYVGNLCCGDGSPPEILLNDGTGHFTSRRDLLPSFVLDNYGPHRYTRSLFVDVNGDHAPDLVLGGENNTPDSRVLLNDGTGHFHDAPAPLPPKPFGPTSILISLATLDVNGDGKPDLIAGFQRQDFTGRRLEILIGNGDGTFRDETAQRLPQQQDGVGWPHAIRVADFNGDGHLDFSVDVNGADEPAAIYLDDGTGTYHFFPFTPANWLFGIVDANGDGHPDIISSGGGETLEPHDLQLDVVAPSAAPAGLRAIGSRTDVRLAWKRVPGATGYEVWRSAGAATKKRIARPRTAAFVDRTAKRGVAYRYAVRATNTAGTGPFSGAVAARRR
jgi:FG-GAP-like repeat